MNASHALDASAKRVGSFQYSAQYATPRSPSGATATRTVDLKVGQAREDDARRAAPSSCVYVWLNVMARRRTRAGARVAVRVGRRVRALDEYPNSAAVGAGVGFISGVGVDFVALYRLGAGVGLYRGVGAGETIGGRAAARASARRRRRRRRPRRRRRSRRRRRRALARHARRVARAPSPPSPACELSPFEVRAWHVWHGTQARPIDAASVAVAGVRSPPGARRDRDQCQHGHRRHQQHARTRARAQAASGWLGSITPSRPSPRRSPSHTCSSNSRKSGPVPAHRAVCEIWGEGGWLRTRLPLLCCRAPPARHARHTRSRARSGRAGFAPPAAGVARARAPSSSLAAPGAAVDGGALRSTLDPTQVPSRLRPRRRTTSTRRSRTSSTRCPSACGGGCTAAAPARPRRFQVGVPRAVGAQGHAHRA